MARAVIGVVCGGIAAATLLVLGAQPAAAHRCVQAVRIEPGEVSAIEVGITAEQSPADGIDVHLPDGFVFDSAEGDGWDITTEDRVIRFRGGRVDASACGSVTVKGTYPRRELLAFPLEVHHVDGTSQRFDGEPTEHFPAQYVFSGADVPELFGLGYPVPPGMPRLDAFQMALFLVASAPGPLVDILEARRRTGAPTRTRRRAPNRGRR